MKWRIISFGLIGVIMMIALFFILRPGSVNQVPSVRPETPEQVARAVARQAPSLGVPVSLQSLSQEDVSSTRDFSFYSGAEAGDWSIRYAETVVLYRPATDKIIRAWPSVQ